MKRFHPLAALLLFVSLFSVPALAGDPPDPMQAVKSSLDRIIAALTSEDASAERRKKIADIFYENFDIVGLAQMTLKSEWKSLDDAQKTLFARKFSEFVLAFYSGKLETYNNNKIEYEGVELKSSGSKAVVNTLIEYQNTMAKVSYSLRLKENQWLIYDVEIEGVRLTSQYRTQFIDVLTKSGFETLMAELDKLIAQYNQPAEAKP